jgi:hypothetical protein
MATPLPLAEPNLLTATQYAAKYARTNGEPQ